MNDGSKKFIAFAKKELKDGWTYHELFRKAQVLLSKYEFYTNSNEVVKRLVKKLELAAEEHGDPRNFYDRFKTKDEFFARINKEIEYEVLDLVFGWPLIAKYYDEIKKS
jgi:hypothetical protein